MPNQVRIGVGVTGAKGAASEVDQLRDKWDKLQKTGAKGFAIGAGAAVTAKAFSLMDGAASALIGTLGDAAEAAREDEESQARLGQSLKENIPNWNGSTKAIEATITARMKLGFSDEEQRKSLAILVAATHDQTKALQIQATAMDLARLKGIDLATASDALVRVEGGQFRALKSLGIVLKDGATATEALAAVQAVANGQAETYANTNSGKLLASQIKVNEAMEKLGYKIMPAITAAAETMADAIDPASEALGRMADASMFLLSPTTLLTNKQREQAQAAVDQQEALEETAKQAFDLGMAFVTAVPHVNTLGDSLKDVADRGGRAYGDLADDAESSAKRQSEAAGQVTRDLLGELRATIDGYFDPLITNDKLAATEAEISAQKRILASDKATDAEKTDARTALHQLTADRAQYLQDLAEAGATHSTSFKKSMAKLLEELKTAHGAERRMILAEIEALKLLERQALITKNAIAIGSAIGSGIGNIFNNLPHKAAGGPVTKGQPYVVGENHAEVFVPEENGRIIPSAPSSPSGGMVGGTSTLSAIPVAVPANWSPAMQQQFARDAAPYMARELRRQGLIR